MILVVIHILITVVIAAIVFWIIDKYVRDRRLSNLLKLLVILVCIAAILQRCCRSSAWACRHCASHERWGLSSLRSGAGTEQHRRSDAARAYEGADAKSARA